MLSSSSSKLWPSNAITTGKITRLLRVKLTKSLIHIWTNWKAREASLEQTRRKEEAEQLLQDVVIAAIEPKLQNGVVGLMVLERCAMLADYVRIFPTLFRYEWSLMIFQTMRN